MDNQLINNLLTKVKQNKKYKSISDEIVLAEIKNYLSKNKISKISKQNIKDIRNQLHKSYASFQTKKKNKIQDYLKELKKNPSNKDITTKLLSITLSTKERLDNYNYIYKKIFDMTGKPRVILDLGAGFNVFSFPLMDLTILEYNSYDVNDKDVEYLNEYYKIMKERGLYGEARILDIRGFREISKLPSVDIIFLFKIIDIIDKENHKLSEELIKQLIPKTKFIIASFATKTLTRKKMNFPKRKWFELMLERNNLKFQVINTNNEIFYVIKK